MLQAMIPQSRTGPLYLKSSAKSTIIPWPSSIMLKLMTCSYKDPTIFLSKIRNWKIDMVCGWLISRRFATNFDCNSPA